MQVSKQIVDLKGLIFVRVLLDINDDHGSAYKLRSACLCRPRCEIQPTPRGQVLVAERFDFPREPTSALYTSFLHALSFFILSFCICRIYEDILEKDMIIS